MAFMYEKKKWLEWTRVFVEIEIIYRLMTSAQCQLLFCQGKGHARKRD